MKKFGILLSLLVTATLSTWAQGAKSIRITEVMPNNQASIVDEYGAHKAWVELSNTSFTTYNIRGMFLTTDRRVLDKNMPPEERRKLMCPLPNNEPCWQEKRDHLRPLLLAGYRNILQRLPQGPGLR